MTQEYGSFGRFASMPISQKKLKVLKLGIFLSLGFSVILLFQNCGAIHLSAVSGPQSEAIVPPPPAATCVANEPCGNAPAQIPAGFHNDPDGVFVEDWGPTISYTTHRCTQFDHCFYSLVPSASFFSPAGEHLNVGGVPNTVYSVKIETPQLGAPVLDQSGNPETLTDYNGNKFQVIYNPKGYSVVINRGDTMVSPFIVSQENISFSAIPFDMGYSTEPSGLEVINGPSNLSSNVPAACNTNYSFGGVYVVSSPELAAQVKAGGGTTTCVLQPGKTYYMNIAIPAGKASSSPQQLYGTLWDMSPEDSLCLCVNPSDYTTCHTMGAGTSCAP